MKIFMAGTGAVASVMLYFLARESYIDEIICVSNNLQEAKKFVQKNRKIKVKEVNLANKSEVIDYAEGSDCIINASLPDFNEILMKIALKTGSNYQDLCSRLYDNKTAEQLKFNKEFERKGLIGMINTGVSPGITNILVREAADKLDTVSDIKIRVFEDQNSSEIVFAWSPHVIMDEVICPPLVYHNGKLMFEKAFGSVENYEFPKPIGMKKVSAFYGDEVSTLHMNIKAKNIDYKACGSDIEILKAFYKLGLFNKESIKVKKNNVVPADLFMHLASSIPDPAKMMELLKNGTIESAVLACSVEVTGKRNQKPANIKSSIICPTIKEISKKFPGATYVSYPTGVSACAFYKSMRLMDKYGVFAPESLDKKVRKNILLELKRNGISVINNSKRK